MNKMLLAGLAASLILGATGVGEAQAEPGFRFAVVDMDRLIMESSIGKAEMQALDARHAANMATLDAKRTEIKERYNALARDGISWTAERRDTAEKELTALQNQLASETSDISAIMSSDAAAASARVRVKVGEVIEVFRKAQGYDAVLLTSAMASFDPALDKTMTVLKGMP